MAVTAATTGCSCWFLVLCLVAGAGTLLHSSEAWVVNNNNNVGGAPRPSSYATTRQLTNAAMQRRKTTTTAVFNVPPPSETSVAEFQTYSSKLPPPASFYELQQHCIRAVRLARRDGHALLEVEYPPLPANVLEMDDVSAYDVSQANLKLALDLGRGLLVSSSSSSSSDSQDESGSSESLKPLKKIAILFPDEPEMEFGIEKAGGTSTPYPGITIGSLRTVDPNDERIFKPENFILNLFGNSNSGQVKAIPDVDLYIILTASAQELPDIEELYNQLDDSSNKATIVFFNLKLDVLRGDLGAPAFPGKDLQDRFLSRIKPAYYLRTRQYSRSTSSPPFIVNFQGCLFRSYPGQYQTLLDTGNGRYRRVVGSDVRPALGTFKQQLTDALKETGVLQEEGSTLNFLRTGYKTTTWYV
jgi:Domain of unknown function (DUF1995)